MKKRFTNFLIYFAFTLMFLASTDSQINTYCDLSNTIQIVNFNMK